MPARRSTAALVLRPRARRHNSSAVADDHAAVGNRGGGLRSKPSLVPQRGPPTAPATQLRYSARVGPPAPAHASIDVLPPVSAPPGRRAERNRDPEDSRTAALPSCHFSARKAWLRPIALDWCCPAVADQLSGTGTASHPVSDARVPAQ